MANPSNKFVSANLNKSYGQQPQQFNGGGGSYGQASASGWGRGGGGVLVLSKNRGSSQKTVSKLSVPPPLNLPSLRKEHERFDTSGPSRGAASGSGARLAPARVGWTKPSTAATLPNKNESQVDYPISDGIGTRDESSRGVGSYIPPSARSTGLGSVGSSSVSISRDFAPSVEKATVLRGEDFPSLQAARPVSSEASQKQKDALNQKQKQIVVEELNHQKLESNHIYSLVDVHPSGQPSWSASRNVTVDRGEAFGTSRGRLADRSRKEDESFPSPLPLVRLNTRSDWADDERDTSHGFTERGRDTTYSKGEGYWNGKFDLPRPSALPHKVDQSQYDRWGKRDNEPTAFDYRDLFSSGVGVIKRKKDTAKSTDFHDPVRESFQAELERVQKLQELERQRIAGEQEKALEQARREEDERRRRIREEEERQRRLEEEAREAAWRAEHERLEAIRIAEERRINREEETKRIIIEEERRKQAAKQKLLELEAAIAKRQAQAASTAKSDISVSSTMSDKHLETTVKGKNFSRTQDLDTWEDNERLVDKFSIAASFDPFASSRPYGMSLRSYTPSESSSSFLDTKGTNYWRRDIFENSSGIHPSQLDPDIDHYSARHDAYDSGRAVSGVYPYGRARNSTRQPRVLPPPLASAQRTFDRLGYHSGSAGFLENEVHYGNTARRESIGRTLYTGGNQRDIENSEVVELEQNNSNIENHSGNNRPRCDSQSSLSVSSPPNSPPQLSHDELDADSPIKSSVEEVTRNFLVESESAVLNDKSGIMASDSVSASENEEWASENDDVLQQQEEYDEDEDGYIEEDEVREGDVDNFVLNQKLENLELEETETSLMEDNIVLGFDDGVEVVIPSDDFEKISGTDSSLHGIHDNSVNTVEEREQANEVPAEEQNLLNGSDTRFGATNASEKIQENEVMLEGSIVQPVDAASPYMPTTDLIVPVDSLSTISPANQLVSCSNVISADVGRTDVTASAGNMSDLPVKLQFGLFTGQSLFPSPVPAIQIGSIQMPLHIHPSVGPSFTYMKPSESPVFQFGQLQYTSPMSQGILSMAPQSMSFAQPNMHANFNLNLRDGNTRSHQSARGASSHNVANDEVRSLNDYQGIVVGPHGLPLGSLSREINSNSKADRGGEYSAVNITRNVLTTADKETELKSVSLLEEKGRNEAFSKNHLLSSKKRGSESQTPHIQQSIQSDSGNKNLSGQRGHGPFNGGRNNRFAYAVKNSNTVSSSMARDKASNTTGMQKRLHRTAQHTEFRIRENSDRGKAPLVVSLNDSGLDEKYNYVGKAAGVFRRNGSKRGIISNRPLKHMIKSEPLASGNIYSQDKVAKDLVRNASLKSQSTSKPDEANLRKSITDDVDAPLQRGVVRIYKQPGIEAPSDEDDFIEVRSKRQMLSERREQREKEIKAKSLTIKRENEIQAKSPITKVSMHPPRKSHPPKQNDVVSRGPSKISAPLDDEEYCSDFSVLENHHLANNDVSADFITAAFQPPKPIGTPTINSDALATKPQTGTAASVSGAGIGSEDKSKVMNQIQSPSSTWTTSGLNQQVISLTQTQLEEAMIPVRYDTHASSCTVTNPMLPTSSVLAKEKTFTSGASPINSLLAGEKIQFGAVTSPTVLPPSSRVITHGIGAPGSSRPDLSTSRKFPVSEHGNSLFFGKEKHINHSCPVQDSEAEAEAAASAVAAAAICVDDLLINGMGPLCSSNVTDTVTFSGVEIDGVTTGGVVDPQLINEPRSEELLSVSLPADLSVETTPISLWPTLTSPQSSSNQMLSHFSAGPPSHFPFYEMNSVLEGPILAFSPLEETSGSQSQPQKSTSSNTGPIGNWQQWHSGVDSFYNTPTGYPGRFVGPSGVPGVQGPPHMVVYNHFAPVGQYGPFGLSFVGTTFIPSGQTSTAIHVSEADISNINTSSAQHNTSNMMAPHQRLAPGSPLLPMASPLPMFNLSPFQTAPDLSVQARWGHIPASQVHSVPLSSPMRPPVDVTLPPQVNHGHSIDRSVTASMFSVSQIQTSSNDVSSLATSSETNSAPFAAELGLVDSIRSTPVITSGSNVIVHSSSVTGNSELGNSNVPHDGNLVDNSSKLHITGPVKNQFSQKNHPVQQGSSTGYNHQRGGISHRTNSGNEWPHRRMSFHGRSHSSADRGFPPKVKQIYVAKTDR